MVSKKSLQKFTDIEKLNSVKEVEAYLIKNPDSHDDVFSSLKKKHHENYKNDLGNDYDLTNMLIATLTNPEKIEDIKNTTYEVNHKLITQFIHNHILEYRSFPHMTNIIENTKLSRQTVYNHLKDGINSKHNKLVKGVNEIMSLHALSKLYLIGIQDNNTTALKHFIQLSGLVNNANTTNVNNYIQINNLKITNEDFNNLPKEDIIQIEGIISKTLK